ncbi:MAG: zinc-binding dehydrogenase [Chloracidobacterium sp.]|uniref:Alcohol dehydrogenase catalytic domain-containing protein n=1 Tax=Chloracidobacterium validum TaxID=2821543 RepID=A0ABX8B806_9BACT|nr:zinc-binding dehydrogenase [Chloracidobacterium validum]QUW02582.1 alcohol dehydrogenase catalytic domain-containing protein [Chloracidobacterium validum]
MNAIVFHAPHEIGWQSIALPPMTPTSVRVATKLTSISAGTERMTLEGRLPGMPQLRYPLIPGYENVGEVVEVGADVDPAQFKVGDRVFLPGTVRYEGFFSVFGGQVSESISEVQRPIKVPDGISDETALLLALGATAHHGVRDLVPAGNQPSVLVLGQGIVGQLAARMLTEAGAEVTVADTIPFRVGLGEADHFIVVNQESDIPSDSFDVVVEATGNVACFDTAVRALKKHGHLRSLGFYEDIRFAFGPAFIKEIRLDIAGEWDAQDIAATCRFLAAQDDALRQLLTHQLPASDPVRAYGVALRDPECLKIALTW